MERAEVIREKGTNRSRLLRGEVAKYEWMDVGSSFLPSELTAAFLFAQLERAREINSRRGAIAERYREAFQPLVALSQISLPQVSTRKFGNGHIFCFLANTSAEQEQAIRFLREKGVGAAFHYLPLHLSPAGRRYGRAGGRLAVSEDVASRLVRLPIFFELSVHDQERVISAVQEFYSAHRSGSAPKPKAIDREP